MSKDQNQEIQVISLPGARKSHWRKDLYILLKEVKAVNIELDCKDWILTYKDFEVIDNIFKQNNLNINKVRSFFPETLVSASAFGLETQLTLQNLESNFPSNINPEKNNDSSKLLFHKGTLRSGENLSAEGDILLLGDVNPGAQISAGGNILIWGRLRGIAHAGKQGNRSSRITALELRPLQLRIANEIARGPAEMPEVGLAEEARIEKGEIIIEPARSNFSY